MPTSTSIRENITDIAGVRVTCSFVPDTYRLFDLLTAQDDVTVLAVKDYVAQPKENGYKSLHAIVEVPVFLSTGRVQVPVEVQFRTIAMDFWASLEHKIYYKYDRQVPRTPARRAAGAAHTAAELDTHMELLHRELHGPPARPAPRSERLAGLTRTRGAACRGARMGGWPPPTTRPSTRCGRRRALRAAAR